MKLDYKAVIFDMDGVVTDTARVHANAWKRLFDGYLKEQALKEKIEFIPFSLDKDYELYVDGKVRYQGVDSFLRSRNRILPYGDPSDKPDVETVCGLGNRKDILFNAHIKEGGVQVFPSTVSLINDLKENGIDCAVVSSSKNCQIVLQAAKIENVFDVRIDGANAGSMNLKGKPAPDMFLKAAELMKHQPAECVVVEDALSGVQAAAAGRFGLVIGIARNGQGKELKANGADLVVTDLAEASLSSIQTIFLSKKESCRSDLNAAHPK